MTSSPQEQPLRAAIALTFGLVHGFGFANVLREFGLPREALGWSLFSFNVGVEMGQLLIVALVTSALALVMSSLTTTVGPSVTGCDSVVMRNPRETPLIPRAAIDIIKARKMIARERKAHTRMRHGKALHHISNGLRPTFVRDVSPLNARTLCKCNSR